jgi:hypothetical protein
VAGVLSLGTREDDEREQCVLELDEGSGTWVVRDVFTRAAIEVGTKVELLDVEPVVTDAAAGTYFLLASNASRTISAPLRAIEAQELTYDLLNDGGSLSITWDGVFLRAGSWTDPANGKRRLIRFVYDGVNWVEMNRTAADV